ncbi:M20 family metallopeptidase [Lewinella sp. LCG006]|uniref:M20 metallopeptidase family protein n=1 Tax=Lewinella sp. LCG006 TaxID=3231911 RepID=UPI003460FE77
MLEAIKDKAALLHKEVIDIRRHLHTYPELSFEEYETGKYIAGRLQAWGIPHQYPFSGTGVVALIEGGKGTGPVIALRADIDALPISEKNKVSYCSQNEGIMHACGHDVHSSSLLGTAKILWDLRKEFAGTIKLIFQPGEEKAPGGASIMIKDGVLKNPAPAHIFGQHVHPPLEVGKIGIRPGLYMASADELYLTVTGRGGHGALPQNTVDPIVITAQIITALQTLVSREGDPILPSVLTFGQIASTGGATNIIPNEVKLKGTFRTMDEQWRAHALRRIQEIADGIAKAMGGSAQLDLIHGYPFLHNDEALTARATEYARAYMGQENVVELPIRMTSEDFSYYSQEIPACFYRLGTGNPARGITSPVHTNTFDVDEECLLHSTGLMAWLAMRELGSKV